MYICTREGENEMKGKVMEGKRWERNLKGRNPGGNFAGNKIL